MISLPILTAITALFGGHLAPWRVLEKTVLTWTSGRPAYTVIIEQPRHFADHEDEWQRLRIQVAGHREFVAKLSPGPLVTLKDQQVGSTLVRDNLALSRYLYLSPKLRDRSGAPMAILFGYAFASNPGSLTIFGLDSFGSAYEVFRSEEFDLTDLVDLNGDHLAEIVGKHSLSQCGRCDHCSYDPFAVYQLPATAGGRAVYSPRLSRLYNLAHYVWAGPKALDSAIVNLCNPKAPRWNRGGL